MLAQTRSSLTENTGTQQKREAKYGKKSIQFAAAIMQKFISPKPLLSMGLQKMKDKVLIKLLKITLRIILC